MLNWIAEKLGVKKKQTRCMTATEVIERHGLKFPNRPIYPRYTNPTPAYNHNLDGGTDYVPSWGDSCSSSSDSGSSDGGSCGSGD